VPQKTLPKKKKRKPRSKFTARTADRHVLYQLSVQDADTEIQFFDRVFKKLRARPPSSLREDFCGTALLCATWAKKRGRTATGIDLDPDVLAWGIEHNLKPNGEPGRNVTLLEQDVRQPVRGRFDLAVGLNFSYFIFKTRPDLLAYFKSVHQSLVSDGMFILDAYGGYEAMEPMEEARAISGGFTYVWDQDKVDPINNGVVNHIHFGFRDGTKIRKAFTYDWRMWTLMELRELLEEAGFHRPTVYWEDGGEDGEGTGVFRPKTSVENEAAWVAYMVAER
jgi:SAM-dependent methyltransferase